MSLDSPGPRIDRTEEEVLANIIEPEAQVVYNLEVTEDRLAALEENIVEYPCGNPVISYWDSTRTD